MLKTLGATGILLEYEDMFPYKGILSSIAAKNAYTRRNLLDLLQAAKSLELNVIPLVQTFGHLEFALKLKEFYHLREVPESPQSLCPSLNSSFIFINEIITQIIEFHTMSQRQQSSIGNDGSSFGSIPEMTHIHIGCDEVYQLGECPRCREKIHDQLFLDHVYNVAAFVKKKFPNLKVVIWDDQLRQISTEMLKNSGIGKIVEPMVWVYAEGNFEV
jgi:hexosaminidase